MESTHILIVTLTLYLAWMLLIGHRASRHARSADDFFLAGRNLRSWVTAVSSTASSESAWAVIGTVGMAYKDGLSAFWFMPGCLLGYAINWFLLADRLRAITRRHAALTLPDFIERRFADTSHVLRGIASAIIFLCMMAYVASQFAAIGKTFDAMFHIPYYWSIPVGGLIVLGYTAMGGFLAVAWTDFVQGLLMAGGVAILALLATASLGGFAEMTRQIGAVDPLILTWTGGKSTAAFLGSAVGLLGIGLGYPGQPHVVTRYMAARDSAAIRRGTWIALGWGALIYGGAIVLGVCGRVLVPDLADPEHLFPRIASLLLPSFGGAIVLTAVLAAIMSTVSSQIMVAASTVAHDVYCQMLRRAPSHAHIVRLSRATVLALGLGAVLVALSETRVIFWFVLFAWSGLGASFGPLILFALYSRRVTRQGAAAGMLTGFFVTIAWKLSGLSETVIYELVPAFALSALAVYGVSLMTPAPDGAELDL